MKKAYVKPIMESEEFVANEYVAACWKIICENGEWEYWYNKPSVDWIDRDGDGFGRSWLGDVQGYYYTGKIAGNDPETKFTYDNGIFDTNIKVHKVSIIELKGTNDPHPNASV